MGATALLFIVDAARQLMLLPTEWSVHDSIVKALAVNLTMLLGDVGLMGLVALAVWLAVRAHAWLVARVGRPRSTSAIIAAAWALPLAIYFSAGRGLARLIPRWASLALLELLIAAGLSVGAWLLVQVIGWIDARSGIKRQLATLGLVAASVGLLVGDRYVLWGLYPPFHLVVAAGAALVALVAFREPQAPAGAERIRALAAGAMVVVALGSLAVGRAHYPLIFTRALLTGTGSRHSARLLGWLEELGATPVRAEARRAPGHNDSSGLQPGAVAPNVIVVSVDGVRASSTGFLGHGHDTTPFLDKFAAQSLLFRRAYSPATNTADTLLRVLTHGTIGQLQGDDVDHPEQSCRRFKHPTVLPQIFNKGGYRSVCAVTYARAQLACVARLCNVGVDSLARRRVFDLVLEQIRSANKPVFGFMHLLETHFTYTGFDHSIVAQTPGWSRYERSIRGMDRAVGEFVRKVEQVSDRPVIWVFVADHGESFGEHGYHHHNSSLFEQQVHVPLLIHGPGITPGQVRQPVSTEWIFDTLLPLAGRAPAGPTLPLRPGASTPPVFLHNARWYGVVRGRFKYFEDRSTGARWLFDLAADPGEAHNLVGEQAERAARLERLVRHHRFD